jgi:hypothetical protein
MDHSLNRCPKFHKPLIKLLFAPIIPIHYYINLGLKVNAFLFYLKF